jgi:hypothetical protein
MGGVTSVISPDSMGTMVEMTAKEDMEKAIMEETVQKFLQAMDTPFMTQPLLLNFGYMGLGPHATEVLMMGQNDIPEGVDPYTSKFIHQLAMEPSIQQAPPIWTYFTTEEWKQGWWKSKERTSSASDFLHFRHFKAGCTNDVIANFEATMANIPILSGYAPRRWCKAIDCMLLKKPGEFHINKLCTIVLFDPEVNFTFKYIGRSVMAHAKAHNQLPKEQYGSWKKKNCHCTCSQQKT